MLAAEPRLRVIEDTARQGANVVGQWPTWELIHDSFKPFVGCERFQPGPELLRAEAAYRVVYDHLLRVFEDAIEAQEAVG